MSYGYPPSSTTPAKHILRAIVFLAFVTVVGWGAFERAVWLLRGWF